MVHGISAVSRVDSKGRVSIPVGLRYKLKLIEGVNIEMIKEMLIKNPNKLISD